MPKGSEGARRKSGTLDRGHETAFDSAGPESNFLNFLNFRGTRKSMNEDGCQSGLVRRARKGRAADYYA
jgi:hypothetical protein